MKIILVDAVHTFVLANEGIYEPLYELLQKYPNKKIVLTNANDEQMKKYGLDTLPYEVFTLKHNPDKTNPEYFRKMLSHFNLKPEGVIYFEHSNDAVKSAQSVGITSYYYDKEKRDMKTLKAFIDQNLSE